LVTAFNSHDRRWKQAATVRRLQGAQAASVVEDAKLFVRQAPVSVGLSPGKEAGDHRFSSVRRSDPFFFDANGNSITAVTGDDFFKRQECVQH